MKNKPKRKYVCKICGKSWNEYYLKDLCEILDMEDMENDKFDTTNRTSKNDKRITPDNVRKSKMV